ncbi:AMP-binding protein [Ruficoccus amylovorans]|uniref:AMP-binding protein n=1 Tax=Ruficoccus amylovorans TaxID=1804625 RepID=A0A842HIB8_9BACT|nr:fatty acid CoA ligase family protein [Ruficoccus amylovorans]MBC2596099.1 AMP-binding protein [Ruficoccus amylovorans]
MAIGNANVARYLALAAETAPDAPAVKLPHRREGELRFDAVSFGQLKACVRVAAAHLRARGIDRGTRVLLMVKPGFDLIVTVFALFKLGAVPVVIDPGMGWGHFRACVRQSKPEALVGIPAATWLSPLLLRGYRFRSKITVGSRSWRTLLAGALSGAKETGRSADAQVAVAAPSDLAAILFTSGSTGPAKGVRYEHGMFEAQVRLLKNQYRVEPGEVDLTLLPVFALFNPALGMCTVVPEMDPSRPAAADPAKIVEAIQKAGVTNSFGSPALWSLIARYCEREGKTLPSVRRIQMAGAPVPPGLIRRMKPLLPAGEINTPYGATEALPVATISGREVLEETQPLTDEGRGTCVGAVFPEMQARIIRLTDEPLAQMSDALCLPPGEIGEITVCGPSVTRSYEARPDATAAAKLSDPADPAKIWHRMGDLGYFDERGRLWFCGRKAERVRTAQGDLYTDCCEAIFNRQPDVYRSALIGLGQPGKQVPAIVIEPEPGKFPSTPSARQAFEKKILAVAATHPVTSPVKRVFFEQRFPVDVRHNAKIHRLTLAKKFSKAL